LQHIVFSEVWWQCPKLNNFTLTIGGCTMHQQQKIAELVSGGADPIKAQCAIYGVLNSNAAVCGAAATK
jgi:hypothetical protein